MNTRYNSKSDYFSQEMVVFLEDTDYVQSLSYILFFITQFTKTINRLEFKIMMIDAE